MKAMKPSRIVAYAAFILYLFLISLFLGLGCIPTTFTLLDFKAWVSVHYVSPSIALTINQNPRQITVLIK